MAGDWKAIRTQLGDLRDRVRDEVSGDRAGEIRRRIDGIRDRVGGALEGEDAQRIRREAREVRDQARAAIDDALADERTKAALGKVEALIEDVGERVQKVLDRTGETRDGGDAPGESYRRH